MGKFNVTLFTGANHRLLSLYNGKKLEYAQIYTHHLLEIKRLIYFKDTLVSKLNEQNKSTEKHSVGLWKTTGRSDN